jgi:hypothetical protein
MIKKTLNKIKPPQKVSLTKEDEIMIKKIEILTQAVERVYPSAKGLMWRSFIQGIFVGLGTTVGLAIVIGIATFIIAQLKDIPAFRVIIDQTKVEQILPDKTK